MDPQGSAGLWLRFFRPQPDTNLIFQDEGNETSTLCGVAVYSQLSLALIAPTHGGMARLSCPRRCWLHTAMIFKPTEWLPSPVLTGPDVEQRH